MLPFDLRGRRTIVYEAPENFDRTEVRGLLQGRLEGALRVALAPGTRGPLPTGANVNLWWGPWSFSGQDALGGELFIREVGPDGFLFDIDVFHGAHFGAMTSYARTVSHDLAYCRIPNGDEGEVGELVFRRQLRDGRRIIEVEETAPCSYHRGMRANFGGRFERLREPWFDAGIINELELSRLYALTGVHLERCARVPGTSVSVTTLMNFPQRLHAVVLPGCIPSWKASSWWEIEANFGALTSMMTKYVISPTHSNGSRPYPKP